MTEPDYLIEGLPCCAGCFCNHDAEEIESWNAASRKAWEIAAQLRSEQQERDQEIDRKAHDERMAALHEHLARFRR